MTISVSIIGCAGPSSPALTKGHKFEEPKSGFFLPADRFGKTKQTPTLPQPKAFPRIASFSHGQKMVSKVVLYVSPTTQNFLINGNVDPGYAPQVWEVFLKKYKIPYQIASSLRQLEASSRDGISVLILPSTVALSSGEKQAVLNFRANGGSVFATWLCGVRDEHGAWVGFEFMENVLDAKVVGDTSKDKDDNFVMPQGDNPVSNALPAGQRVWLERIQEWYPLRLVGRNSAAHVMDWSRTFDAEKHTAVMVFDERETGPTGASRTVVIGYPERLWQSADPKHLEAINYNAITWLLRLQSAYKAAWPAPYSSATALTIDAAEVIAAPDMSLASLFENIGARATYYSVAEHVPKSAANLKILQARGHELAFMGDTFNGFKGQPIATQASRIEKMQQKFKEVGLAMPKNPGFHAPTESYDKSTESVLRQSGFSHYISFMDATDSRLPFIAQDATSSSAQAVATVVLPRTQRGPEDATEEGDIDDGLKSFFAELTLAEKMSGLSVIRLPTQSILPIEDWEKVVNDLKARKDRMWMATGWQIANWWRERERVNAFIEGNSNASELKVEISGSTELKEPVAIWINLPRAESIMTLEAINPLSSQQTLPKTYRVDQWRAGVLLSDLKPGIFRWKLQFKSQE
jgi:Polysaccharide deacetylase